MPDAANPAIVSAVSAVRMLSAEPVRKNTATCPGKQDGRMTGAPRQIDRQGKGEQGEEHEGQSKAPDRLYRCLGGTELARVENLDLG